MNIVKQMERRIGIFETLRVTFLKNRNSLIPVN